MILMTDLSFLRFSSCLDREKMALNLSLPASFLMTLFVYSVDAFLVDYSSKLLTMLSVSLTIVTAAILYFLSLYILKFPESKGILKRA